MSEYKGPRACPICEKPAVSYFKYNLLLLVEFHTFKRECISCGHTFRLRIYPQVFTLLILYGFLGSLIYYRYEDLVHFKLNGFRNYLDLFLVLVTPSMIYFFMSLFRVRLFEETEGTE
jgi:hypothetical protein